MMLCQNLLEVVGESCGLLLVAIGDVSDQIDNVVERLDRIGACGGRRNEENLALSLILFPLL